MRRSFAALLAVLLIAVLISAGCSAGERSKSGPTATPLPGTVLDPPREVTDFTLTNQAGEPAQLSDWRGKAVLMFFGYTSCPDICPNTLGHFKLVKRALGDDAARVAFVFVSVDGARDTPERLNSYVTAFDPDFIGLTGNDAAMQTLVQDYGVFYQRVGTGDDYTVDHTASSFVVDPEGRLAIIFPYDTEPGVIAERIRALLDGA